MFRKGGDRWEVEGLLRVCCVPGVGEGEAGHLCAPSFEGMGSGGAAQWPTAGRCRSEEGGGWAEEERVSE